MARQAGRVIVSEGLMENDGNAATLRLIVRRQCFALRSA